MNYLLIGLIKSHDVRFPPLLMNIINGAHQLRSQLSVYPFQNSPLRNSKYNLTPEQYVLLINCIHQHQGLRLGNCYAMSEVVIQDIWAKCSSPGLTPTIKRIELVKTKTFDHYMVIINREGDLKNSDTWGDAWIIDPWYGKRVRFIMLVNLNKKLKLLKNTQDGNPNN
jgi:hypothetical protein